MAHAELQALAPHTAHLITQRFEQYQTTFHAITCRAAARFADQDWHALHRDSEERLDLYLQVLDPLVAAVRETLGEYVHDHDLWQQIKTTYADLIAERPDREIAETFFNSVTRRVFTTVGVDAVIEFVGSSYDDLAACSSEVCTTYPVEMITSEVIADMLRGAQLGLADTTLEQDAVLVAERINTHLVTHWGSCRIDGVEMLQPVFFRNKGAYLVGRIRYVGHYVPLVLPVLHTAYGPTVDAVLLRQVDISMLFSFAHSSFHVDTMHPRALVHFLHEVMPSKPIAEIYVSIGYPKHAKTERYRALQEHMRNTTDQFRIAPGERGMVMLVFDLPSYDVVFKVIKDRFAYPKTTTRRDVMQRYHLVAKHDRGGRLVDAQEFEHLRFERRRFSSELLDELQRVAANSVIVDDQHVVITHAYIQRRLTPLNLYLQMVDADAARAAVLDYGQAIKDLAATNIYPGDILLKNFGVTRHGRVVFYDYDELCLLSDCTVRTMPAARNDDEDWAAEPWFFVGEHDFFPEELRTFLGLKAPSRDIFARAHGDLFEVPFWANLQARHRAGEIIDLFPYREDMRLRPGAYLLQPA